MEGGGVIEGGWCAVEKDDQCQEHEYIVEFLILPLLQLNSNLENRLLTWRLELELILMNYDYILIYFCFTKRRTMYIQI